MGVIRCEYVYDVNITWLPDNQHLIVRNQPHSLVRDMLRWSEWGAVKWKDCHLEQEKMDGNRGKSFFTKTAHSHWLSERVKSRVRRKREWQTSVWLTNREEKPLILEEARTGVTSPLFFFRSTTSISFLSTDSIFSLSLLLRFLPSCALFSLFSDKRRFICLNIQRYLTDQFDLWARGCNMGSCVHKVHK